MGTFQQFQQIGESFGPPFQNHRELLHYILSSGFLDLVSASGLHAEALSPTLSLRGEVNQFMQLLTQRS